jgi:hypothetical protein
VRNVLKSGDHHGKISMKCDLISESETFLFNCDRVSVPSLRETRCWQGVDTLSWLLEHYSETIEALKEIAKVSAGQSAADSIPHHVADFFSVHHMLRWIFPTVEYGTASSEL